LADTTIFYWRVISAGGSPDVVRVASLEYTNKTFSIPGAEGAPADVGGGQGPSGAAQNTPGGVVAPVGGQVAGWATEYGEEEFVEPTPTPEATPTPTPEPEVKGVSTSSFSWWYIITPAAGLFLLWLLLHLLRRKKE